MKRCRNILICVVSGLTLGASARAVSVEPQDNPYEGIAERNLFGLKPFEPDTKDLPPPPKPPPQITLQGTTSILGFKMVMFKAPTPVKPGEQAKDKLYSMKEREPEDGIEVLEIDEKAGAVKFDNHGVIQSLTLDKDGAKPGASSSGPGAPPPMAAGIPAPSLPSYSSSPNATTIGVPAQRTIPMRTLRVGSPASGMPAPGAGQQPVAQPPGQQQGEQSAQEPARSLSPEEKAAILNVLGQMPDFPPAPPPPPQ